MKSPDRIDYEIIRLLRNNARLSNKEIAHKVGLAPSTCLARVRHLQSTGVLKGFHAEVDPNILGFGLQALIAIRLKRHSHPEVEAFRAHSLALPEVVQLYHVAGPTDFLVHVWVRDSQHLRELAMKAFTTRDEVAHMETGLIFEHTQSMDLPVSSDVFEDEV